jgi:hypothetical protein
MAADALGADGQLAPSDPAPAAHRCRGDFYLGRVASALYFAPRALYWGLHPGEAATHLDQVALWIRLDLIRLILQDAVNAALLLLAALHPKFRLASSTTAHA